MIMLVLMMMVIVLVYDDSEDEIDDESIIDLPSKNTAWGNAFNFRQLSYQLAELHLGQKKLYQKWIFIEIVSFMIL